MISGDEGQGSQTSTRKLVRTNESTEIKCSQVRRQENTQHSDYWTRADREEASNSTGTRKLVRAATPRTEPQNMKCTNKPSVHDEGLPFPTKEVRNYSRTLNIFDGSIKDKCIDMGNVHVFVMKAAIHLGPNYLANLEIYKNTNFEEIQRIFNITQKLISEHSEDSECTYDSQLFSILDEISLVS